MNIEGYNLIHNRIPGLIFLSYVTLGKLFTISLYPVLHSGGSGVED